MPQTQYHPASRVDSCDASVEPIVRAEERRPVIEQWDLRDTRPSKALPSMVSDELSGMYFEVYRAPETHLTAILRSGGDWRWHFCTSDGCVEVTSGSYPTETACISAIDILRAGAPATPTCYPSKKAEFGSLLLSFPGSYCRCRRSALKSSPYRASTIRK